MTDEKFRPSEIVEQYYRDLKDFALRLAFLRTLRVFHEALSHELATTNWIERAEVRNTVLYGNTTTLFIS